ncbi:MAG: DUF3857 domain-containing protein [Bacteroidetes bacterium]|nr:DUF3857 domain-containing protein [Bacteroidota bacterium]
MKTLTACMFTALTFMIIPFARGQDYSKKFGDVSMDEMTLISCPGDLKADAMVLYDIGKSSFVRNDNGFYIVFEDHARIKIFRKPGFKSATIEIPLYQYDKRGEELNEIKAVTYNLVDGKIKATTIDLNTIYEEKITENHSVKKFTLPDLKEGSVIEYKYKVLSPFLFSLPGWDFQREIPTLLSDYTVFMIPFYEYTYVLQGASGFDEFENYKDEGIIKTFGPVNYYEMVTHFVMKEVPAFKEEPFTTTKEDYLIKIDFQLSKETDVDGTWIDVINTWDKLGKDLMKDVNFGKYMSNCQSLAKGLFDIPKLSSMDENARFYTIVKETKSMVRWDDKNRIYVNKTAKNFVAEKTGNSAAVNLFLAGALNAGGIESYPVLLSTRSNGKVKVDYPFLHYFDYVAVIAKVNEKWILTDATEIFCPDGSIPPHCINGKGLIVFKDKTGWVDLLPRTTGQKDMEFTMEPAPGRDSIPVTCNIMYTGYEAYFIKKNLRNKQDELFKYYQSDQLDPEGKIETFNYEDPNKNYVVHFKCKIPAETLDGKIIISPVPNDFLPGRLFPEAVRKLPVNLNYYRVRTFTSRILIPEGYKVSKLPEDYSADDDYMKITYSSKQEGNMIVISAMYSFKKVIYQPQEYINLRLHFIDLNSIFNQKVVMEKS